MKLKIVGIDISLNNLGAAIATYDTVTDDLKIQQVGTFCPSVSKSKQVRQNSKDLEQARQLSQALEKVTSGAHLICTEVPHGSQSARAMASYGVCVGVLGALRTNQCPFIEVTAGEVKQVVGKKDATKKEVITWVQQKHPEAPLETFRGVINLSKAEHQADAIVAIHAAMKTDVFKSLKTLAKETNT